MFKKAAKVGKIKGFILGNEKVRLTPDDTLIFSEANIEEIPNIKRTLRCLEAMSSLKINYHKSTVSGIGVDDVSTNQFATVLKCAAT